jgi:23S rRNA (guanosine2251-2'-O)-methyltransferase
MEALLGGKKIEKIFFQYGSESEALNTIRQEAQKHGIPVAIMDKSKFLSLEREVCSSPPSHGRTSGRAQGVIAIAQTISVLGVIDMIEACYQQSERPLVVALDGITDPHNMGAIARSVECAGAQGIVVPESRSAPLGSTALKTSAGALEHILVARTASMSKAVQDFRHAGFTTLALDGRASTCYTEKLYHEATLLIVGSEGSGISPSVRQNCTHTISIPLHGSLSSLNASVAVGVVLFEAVRQRQNKDRSNINKP